MRFKITIITTVLLLTTCDETLEEENKEKIIHDIIEKVDYLKNIIREILRREILKREILKRETLKREILGSICQYRQTVENVSRKIGNIKIIIPRKKIVKTCGTVKREEERWHLEEADFFTEMCVE